MNRRQFAVLALTLPLLAAPARADAKFEAFIQSLWPTAKANGIAKYKVLTVSPP